MLIQVALSAIVVEYGAGEKDVSVGERRLKATDTELKLEMETDISRIPTVRREDGATKVR